MLFRSQIDGFQLKSATNVHNAIHKVIDKPQPLERVMMASGVFPLGLGEKKFKLILDAIPNFLSKFQTGKITKQNILDIPGFADKTSDIFMTGMKAFLEWLKVHSMIKIEKNDNPTSADSGTATRDVNGQFAGMVAVFTGVRNADMEAAIVKGGGQIGSSISGKTTVVIAKDPSESSSKIKKAREMDIEVIGIDTFAKKYNLAL